VDFIHIPHYSEEGKRPIFVQRVCPFYLTCFRVSGPFFTVFRAHRHIYSVQGSKLLFVHREIPFYFTFFRAHYPSLPPSIQGLGYTGFTVFVCKYSMHDKEEMGKTDVLYLTTYMW